MIRARTTHERVVKSRYKPTKMSWSFQNRIKKIECWTIKVHQMAKLNLVHRLAAGPAGNESKRAEPRL